jgi:hypothetical protein
MAVIKVGAATEVEMKEKKARVKMPCTQPALQLKRVSWLASAWVVAIWVVWVCKPKPFALR